MKTIAEQIKWDFKTDGDLEIRNKDNKLIYLESSGGYWAILSPLQYKESSFLSFTCFVGLKTTFNSPLYPLSIIPTLLASDISLFLMLLLGYIIVKVYGMGSMCMPVPYSIYFIKPSLS